MMAKHTGLETHPDASVIASIGHEPSLDEGCGDPLAAG
jgi:hypothetical protein